VCRTDRLAVAAEVIENPFNDSGFFDARDHAEPPAAQRRQVSMSIANTRLRRCAQVRARCRPAAEASPESLARLAAAARAFGKIRTRSGLAGAKTP
jgi:hypothetical protein